MFHRQQREDMVSAGRALLLQETRNSQNLVSVWEEVSESKGSEGKTWRDTEMGPQCLPPPSHSSTWSSKVWSSTRNMGSLSASFHIFGGRDRKAGKLMREGSDDSHHPWATDRTAPVEFWPLAMRAATLDSQSQWALDTCSTSEGPWNRTAWLSPGNPPESWVLIILSHQVWSVFNTSVDNW